MGPIFGVDFVSPSTGSNTHIFSLSNDGQLCIWKDDELAKKPKMSGTLQLSDSTQIVDEYSHAKWRRAHNGSGSESGDIDGEDELKSSPSKSTVKSAHVSGATTSS